MNKKKLQKIQKQLAQIENFATSLNASEHDLAVFFFLSNDLLLISDADGYVKFTNKNLYDSLGCTPGELVGTKMIDRIHPDDYQNALKQREILVSGQPIKNLSNRIKHKDGSYVSICWNSIRVKNGTVYSCAKLNEDKNES